MIGNVTTYSDQTYRANLMNAQAGSQPGAVTFSVWDPAAAVSFNLPEQTVVNSGCTTNCGQINLQNPNSADNLMINGRSNFALDANLSGVNNWGNEFIQTPALGYVPPVFIPATYFSEWNGGTLREVLDHHADQVQMTVEARMLATGVTIASADEVARAISSVMKSTKTSDKTLLLESYDGAVICNVDQYGDSFCGEN